MEKNHFQLSRYVNWGFIMQIVKQVIPHQNFTLELTFSSGETRMFDAKPYLKKGLFQTLQEQSLFKQAYVAFDTVCWPGDLDISPETLYIKSIPSTSLSK